MKSPLLSCSLLLGEMKAAAFRRGAAASTWERLQPLSDLADLGKALREASADSGAAARQVTLVLADMRLSDHLVELPRASGATLARLLDRSANRVKTFQGDVAWSHQPAIPGKNGAAALLHLCPASLREQILQCCQEAELELVRLLPSTAVLASQLKSLPLQKDEIALLVADSGRSTTLVAGRRDGSLCLGRVLPNSWRSAPDRVWMDVARSIGFAEQQSGLAVSSVWLFGEGAEGQLPAAQAAVKTPVKLSPVPYTPFYWVEQAARLPEKQDGNLISVEIRSAPQRQRFLAVTGLLVSLLLLGAVAASAGLERLRRGELDALAEVNQRIARLRLEKAEMEKSLAEHERMRATADFLEGEPPPVPSWFLSYLGQVTPPEFALTHFRVVRTNDLWSVQLAGAAEARTNITESFQRFCGQLADGQFKLSITDQGLGRSEPAPATANAAARLPAQIAQMLRRDLQVPPNAFIIQGVMR